LIEINSGIKRLSGGSIIDAKIKTLDEYWGDDGPIPQWRKDMNIGRPIHQSIGKGDKETNCRLICRFYTKDRRI